MQANEKSITASDEVAFLHPDIPLNIQIYGQLRNEIEDGVWEGRVDFPGEAELARHYGVSVITSRSALDRLANDGLIKRGRGRRTVALTARRRFNESASMLMPASGEDIFTYKLLSAEVGIPPAEACEAYGVPVGTPLWICRRLRRFQGRPHSVTLNVQWPEVGARHSRQALENLPMADSLQKQGLEFSQMKRRVGVGFASKEVAAQLGITMQDPTLIYTFMLLDSGRAPVEWVRIHVHPCEQQHWEVFDIAEPKSRLNARV